MIDTPKQTEDLRLLHKNVAEMTKRLNALLNMTGVMEGRIRGISGAGDLKVVGSFAELRIKTVGREGGDQAKKTTRLVLASSANPVATGVPVHFTASVAADAGGTIQFRVNGVPLGGPIIVVGGVAVSANISSLGPGNHLVTAFYGGNFLYNTAQGSLTQVVSQAVPDITIESNINPAVAEGLHPPVDADRVFWRVHLYPPNPVPPGPVMAGKVQFYIDNHTWGNPVTITPVTSMNYRADSVAWDASDEAYHYVIKGTYLGNNNYRGVSATLDQYVLSRVNVTLEVQPNPAGPDDTVTCDVQVTTPGQSGPIPSGEVQLIMDGAAFGDPATLFPNGTQRFEIDPLPEGEYTLTAHYFGNSRYTVANSPLVTLLVQEGTPVTIAPYIAEALPNVIVSYWFDGTGGYGWNAYNVWDISVGGGFTGILRFTITDTYARISQNGVPLFEGDLNVSIKNGSLTDNVFISPSMSADIQITGGAGRFCIGIGTGGIPPGGNIIIDEGWIKLSQPGGINNENPFIFDLIG